MMKHQAKYYQEIAAEKLTTLTKGASFLIWLLVAFFIIICIFRVAGIYLSALG